MNAAFLAIGAAVALLAVLAVDRWFRAVLRFLSDGDKGERWVGSNPKPQTLKPPAPPPPPPVDDWPECSSDGKQPRPTRPTPRTTRIWR